MSCRISPSKCQTFQRTSTESDSSSSRRATLPARCPIISKDITFKPKALWLLLLMTRVVHPGEGVDEIQRGLRCSGPYSLKLGWPGCLQLLEVLHHLDGCSAAKTARWHHQAVCLLPRQQRCNHNHSEHHFVLFSTVFSVSQCQIYPNL